MKLALVFWVGGGRWSNKTKLILISTQVEVLVEVWLEKVLKLNFDGWLAGGGWLGGWIKWE